MNVKSITVCICLLYVIVIDVSSALYHHKVVRQDLIRDLIENKFWVYPELENILNSWV